MRERTIYIILYILALSVLLTGCSPNAKEPDGMALVRVLGVDGGGPVWVTAVSGGANQQDPARGSALGEDFPAALSALPWVGEEELSLTHLSYIIVGEGADLREVLETVLEDGRLSCTATVWQAGDAAALLQVCTDPAARLEILEECGVKSPTVVEALAELEKRGRASLPRLMAADGMPQLVEEVFWEVWG